MKPTRRATRRKQTRRKRKGGKKLGQGAYGFVVDPAIACVGKDTSGYVSKVFAPKETEYDSAESLLKMVKANPVFAKLREIDPEQKEFIYAEFCDTPGELSEENKADGVTEENKKFGYLMKRGGRSLEEEFKEKGKKYADAVIARYNDVKDSIKKATTIKQGEAITAMVISQLEPEVKAAIAYLKPIVKEVFRLRDKLYENGISQGDLHPGNVLRMDDGTLRIIDFDGAVVFDPKNPHHNYFADFRLEDGGVFIEFAAWPMVTQEYTKDSDLIIVQSKLAQKIVDELSA